MSDFKANTHRNRYRLVLTALTQIPGLI